MKKKLPPIHPGEQLREEFMMRLGLSSNTLAKALNVTPATDRAVFATSQGDPP